MRTLLAQGRVELVAQPSRLIEKVVFTITTEGVSRIHGARVMYSRP